MKSHDDDDTVNRETGNGHHHIGRRGLDDAVELMSLEADEGVEVI